MTKTLHELLIIILNCHRYCLYYLYANSLVYIFFKHAFPCNWREADFTVKKSFSKNSVSGGAFPTASLAYQQESHCFIIWGISHTKCRGVKVIWFRFCNTKLRMKSTKKKKFYCTQMNVWERDMQSNDNLHAIKIL